MAFLGKRCARLLHRFLEKLPQQFAGTFLQDLWNCSAFDPDARPHREYETKKRRCPSGYRSHCRFASDLAPWPSMDECKIEEKPLAGMLRQVLSTRTARTHRLEFTP